MDDQSARAEWLRQTALESLPDLSFPSGLHLRGPADPPVIRRLQPPAVRPPSDVVFAARPQLSPLAGRQVASALINLITPPRAQYCRVGWRLTNGQVAASRNVYGPGERLTLPTRPHGHPAGLAWPCRQIGRIPSAPDGSLRPPGEIKSTSPHGPISQDCPAPPQPDALLYTPVAPYCAAVVL